MNPSDTTPVATTVEDAAPADAAPADVTAASAAPAPAPAESVEIPVKTFSALLFGATGAVGGALLHQLAASDRIHRVTVVSRSPIDTTTLPGDGRKVEVYLCEKFQELYGVDSERLLRVNNQAPSPLVLDHVSPTEIPAPLRDHHVAYCCLGSTKSKAKGDQQFLEWDRVPIMSAAMCSRKVGVRHFQLVSSGGADAASMLFYLRTKGQEECDIGLLRFDQFTAFRPGLLLTARPEKRTLEGWAQKIAPKLSWMLPLKYQAIKVESVARAMLRHSLKTLQAVDDGVCSYFAIENDGIHGMGDKEDEK